MTSMNPINHSKFNIELELDIQLASTATNLPTQTQISQWVLAGLSGANYTPDAANPTELTVRIVDSEESQKLNGTYRQNHKPTNVLSFPFENIPGVPLALLGDLIICAPVVQQEAAEQNKSAEAHWAHLVIHGTLHLLGYDHIKQDEAEQMEGLEIDILHSLGFPDPYVTNN